MKRIAIIQMGLPPESIVSCQGEPASWFAQALELELKDLLIVNPANDEALPNQNDFDVAIITGSWAMVTDKLEWSERTAAWAKELILLDKPLLGVCYGHQLMAYAMGGVVDYNPKGREQGTFSVFLNEAGKTDPLTKHLPSPFMAHLSHAQSVITAPESATVLAYNQHDANQILRYSKNTISFQFHPEFSVAIVKACMQGRDPNAVGVFSTENDLTSTPLTKDLMQRLILN